MQHLPLFADLKHRACPRRRRRRRRGAARDVAARGGRRTYTSIAPELDANACASSRRDRQAHASRTARFDGRLARAILARRRGDRRPRASTPRSPRRPQPRKRFCNVVDDPALCSFIMPAIVDRSPVTIAIGSSGLSPVLARWIKGVIETLLPSAARRARRARGRWRERVRERVADADRAPSFLGARRHGRASRSTRSRAATRTPSSALERALDELGRATTSQRRGEAYLVGAGPGGTDLITIRGRQLLATADVVLYDRLVSAELLQFARRDAELISRRQDAAPAVDLAEAAQSPARAASCNRASASAD